MKGQSNFIASEHVLLNVILGHKVAAAVAAITIGVTGVAAAAAVPFLDQTGEPVGEVDSEETTEIIETIIPDDETVENETVENEAAADETVENETVENETVADDENAAGSDSGEPRSEPPVDQNGDPYGDVNCNDARNHGEYVSSVARDDSIPGPRGRVISEAARTDCGRSGIEFDDNVEREEVDERDEADATEESDVDHGADSVGPGDDHPGNGNGKGEKRAAGKGRGNGRG